MAYRVSKAKRLRNEEKYRMLGSLNKKQQDEFIKKLSKELDKLR
jgi:hypothetical protein